MSSLEEVPESEEKLKFGAEKSDVPSKNRPKTDPERGKTRKKWASQGKKRVRALEKSPEIGFETGKGKKKSTSQGKKRERSSENLPKLDPKRGKTRKKWASRGKKRERSLEKSPEIGFETGKSAKNGDFGAKKMGWGRGEKTGFTVDFAML